MYDSDRDHNGNKIEGKQVMGLIASWFARPFVLFLPFQAYFFSKQKFASLIENKSWKQPGAEMSRISGEAFIPFHILWGSRAGSCCGLMTDFRPLWIKQLHSSRKCWMPFWTLITALSFHVRLRSLMSCTEESESNLRYMQENKEARKHL